MKKLLSVILASLIFAAAGCSDSSGEAAATTTTPETTTEAVTTTTTAVETTTTTTAEITTTEASTTEAITTEAETTTTAEISAGNDADLETTLIVGTGLIQSSKKGDGFVTYDREKISEDIAASGMTEKALTKEAVLADHELYGNNTDNIYTFAMISTDGVQEYPSDTSSVMMSVLILDNVAYTISFGTGEKVTLEDALPYCTPGKYIEYWAFATVNNGNVILLPFIAGTETNGYYLVQPVMEMMNADVSEMYLPQPVGDDYYATEPMETEAPEAEKPAEGSAVLNINGIENSGSFGTFTSVDITIENKYDVPLTFIGNKIVINGVDHGMFVAFCEVPAMSKADNYLWIENYELKAGDELELTFELQNTETLDYFGTITFPLTLEDTHTYA